MLVLTRRHREPTEDEWRILRGVCRRPRHQEFCQEVVDYIARELIPHGVRSMPITLSSLNRGPRMGREAVAQIEERQQQWRGHAIFGLGKGAGSRIGRVEVLDRIGHFGDDAAVIGGRAFALSDGVSQHPESAFLSHQLVLMAHAGLSAFSTEGRPRMHAQMAGLVRTIQDYLFKLSVPAGATLSYGILDASSVLWLGTLGDSQVRIYSLLPSEGCKGQQPCRAAFSSPVQRNGKAPGQLTAGSGSNYRDFNIEPVSVSRGDIVVAASDGLWDNVADERIYGIVRKHGAVHRSHHEKGPASSVADRIGEDLIKEAEAMKRAPRPPRSESMRAAPRKGGINDDIAIQVMVV